MDHNDEIKNKINYKNYFYQQLKKCKISFLTQQRKIFHPPKPSNLKNPTSHSSWVLASKYCIHSMQRGMNLPLESGGGGGGGGGGGVFNLPLEIYPPPPHRASLPLKMKIF